MILMQETTNNCDSCGRKANVSRIITKNTKESFNICLCALCKTTLRDMLSDDLEEEYE